jgi:hypothetical protein
VSALLPAIPDECFEEVDRIVTASHHEAISAACPKTVKGEGMTQYSVAIYLPDDFDPSVQDKSMERE